MKTQHTTARATNGHTPWLRILALAFILTFILGQMPAAQAVMTPAEIAADQADNAAYNDGWGSGDNGGSGFGAWSLSGGSNSGFFVWTAANNGTGCSSGGTIDTSSKSWGLYASSSETASATRALNNAMAVGNAFRIKMDNGWVQNGGTVGFGLQNNAGTNLLEFYFKGNDTVYRYNDNGGEQSSGVGYTEAGLAIIVTYTSAPNTISLSITPVGGSTTTITAYLKSDADQAIKKVRLFNYNAGSGCNYNLFFNRMGVTTNAAVQLASFTAAPRPSQVQLDWATATETNTLGFHVYRADAAGGDWTRLNAAMIPSQAPGSPSGYSYRYSDATVARGQSYWYRVAAVDTSGAETALDAVQATYPYAWRWLPMAER